MVLTGCASVVITDGHPDCVKNQKVCVEMNRQKGVFVQGQGLSQALSGQGPRSVSQGHEQESVDSVDTDVSVAGSSACVIESHLLRWTVDDSHGDFRAIAEARARARASTSIGTRASTSVAIDSSAIASSMTSHHQQTPVPVPPPSHASYFDVVLAADCLFFTDFHDALIDTIKTALTPPSAPSSSSSSTTFTPVAYLLQPRRGGTMETFMRKVYKA